jgi:hypothetical protein
LSKIFLVTLFSSWLGVILAIFIGQILGVTQEPVLIYVLLSINSSTPFQIFLNESIAPNSVGKENSKLNIIIVPVIIIQSLAVITSMFFATNIPKDNFTLLTVTLLTAINAVISFRATKNFYESIIFKQIGLFSAIFMGFLPNFILALIYITASLFIGINDSIMRFILYSIIVLPTLSVWVFTTLLKTKAIKRSKSDRIKLKINWFSYLLLFIFVLLTTIATSLRADISLSNYSFAAIIIVGLSAFYSLLNTITRIIFFSGVNSFKRFKNFSILFVFSSGLTGILFRAWYPIFSDLCALIVVQSLLSYFVQLSRKKYSA